MVETTSLPSESEADKSRSRKKAVVFVRGHNDATTGLRLLSIRLEPYS